MATTFSVPSSPKKSIFQMNHFQGCDFTNSAANVDDYKSPNCVNMVRDVPGKIRKSMGYKTQFQYPGKINGSFFLRSRDEQLIHAGTKLYHNNVIIYDGMRDARSKAFQFGDKLYIQDGKELLVHECEKADDTYTYGSHSLRPESANFSWHCTVREGDTIYIESDITMTSVSTRGSTSTHDYGVITTNPDGSSSATLTITVGGSIYIDITYATTSINITSSNGYIETGLLSDLDAYLSVSPACDSITYAWESEYGVSGSVSIVDNVTLPYHLTNNTVALKYKIYACNVMSTSLVFNTSTNKTRQVDCVVSDEFHPVKWHISSGTLSGVVHTKPDGTKVNVDSSGNSCGVTCSEPGTHYIKYTYKGSTYETQESYVASESDMALTGTGGTSNNTTITIGREPIDGFIDNIDNQYVEEDGYYRKVQKVRDVAYIPTLTIAKDPRGGGETYEALNLIQPAFIELFQGSYIGDNNTEYYSRTFQLSFGDLDATTVKAWLLNSEGDWVEKTEGTHFSVNRSKGIVTFTTAPGASPITGEDNVKIQAYRTVEGYADRINKCQISTLFGVNGNPDRMFVSGNPDYINYDWYSGQNDPTYFPDTGYSVLGSSSSAIIGYSVISNYLAAHKDDKERDMNIILREGNLVDDEPAFPVVATLQGAGAVAPWSFAYLSTEPIFLTKRGIYAVTAQDITGEKYSQNRSYFLDGKLLEEDDLENAYACVYNDFYVLSLNGKLYILDGLQPIQTDKSMPYATRQYACFYRENVPATCMWVFDDVLHFGTADGKVCTFYKDKYDIYSYNDDGEAIPCTWETPDLDGKYFFKNKTFRYIAVRLDSAITSSINIYTMKRGIWNLAKTDSTKARYFTFPYLNFAKFSFSTDTTQKIIHTKLRLKKVDKARFRFTNTEVNEPFGLFDVALEYIENGNYKN